MTPTCRRCGALEAIVHVTLNRGGPRHIEWCQRCLDAFRVWANLPPEPVAPVPPAPVSKPSADHLEAVRREVVGQSTPPKPAAKPKAKKPAAKPKARPRRKR